MEESSYLIPTKNEPAKRYLSEDTGEPPALTRHDSTFSVGSAYKYESPNNLFVWQGAALLTADCLGTGVLALPADIQVLGYGLGLGFLILNLPINLYAGTILSDTATYVEDRQEVENQLYQSSLSSLALASQDEVPIEIKTSDPDRNYPFVVEDTDTSEKTRHTQLHHDTATFDFIGMTQALFGSPDVTTWVMVIYYVNIFLVLGNYILVMSHAVQATFGGSICLPTAGVIASGAMFIVSQSRTMARLGRAASILSLTALFIVVVQCLVATHNPEQAPWEEEEVHSSSSTLRKLSAMGSIGFAVGSQKLFLNIRHELADRNSAPRSLAISLSVFGTFYVLVVLAAGSNPPSFLFDAIGEGWNRQVAGLLLWAHVVVSYAINSQAICSSMDRLVWYRLLPDVSAKLRWLSLTFVMACTAYFVANAVPFFTDLVALIGSLTSVPLTLLLPGIFWRKRWSLPICWPTRESVPSFALIVFATLFMVGATIGSLYSIERDWQGHGPPFSCN